MPPVRSQAVAPARGPAWRKRTKPINQAARCVAQTDGFGPTAIAIAIPVLCVVLFAGVVTVGRLIRLNSDDCRWVIGMNRIRHAYIEMHPELAACLVASPYDDADGALQTLGIERSTMASAGAGSILHLVQTLPGMVAIVVACVARLALHGSLSPRRRKLVVASSAGAVNLCADDHHHPHEAHHFRLRPTRARRHLQPDAAQLPQNHSGDIGSQARCELNAQGTGRCRSTTRNASTSPRITRRV